MTNFIFIAGLIKDTKTEIRMAPEFLRNHLGYQRYDIWSNQYQNFNFLYENILKHFESLTNSKFFEYLEFLRIFLGPLECPRGNQ